MDKHVTGHNTRLTPDERKIANKNSRNIDLASTISLQNIK